MFIPECELMSSITHYVLYSIACEYIDSATCGYVVCDYEGTNVQYVCLRVDMVDDVVW